MGKSWGTPNAPPVFKPFASEFAAARPPIIRSPPTIPTMVMRIQFRPLRRGRREGGPSVRSPSDGAGDGAYILSRTTTLKVWTLPGDPHPEWNGKLGGTST